MSKKEKYDIFISYSRKDFYLVRPIVSEIEALGIKVWFDLTGIESGEQFINEIVSAIDNSDSVIYMYSENSVVGEWTQKEILYAKDQGKIVRPVLVNGRMPGKGWFKLMYGNVDCIDITNSLQRKKLMTNLATTYGNKPPTPKPTPSPVKPTPQPVVPKQPVPFKMNQQKVYKGTFANENDPKSTTKKWLWLALVFLLIMIIIGVVISSFGNSADNYEVNKDRWEEAEEVVDSVYGCLRVSDTQLNVESEGGTYSVHVYCDDNWSITTSPDSWIKATEYSDYVELEVETNFEDPRYDYFIITSSGGSSVRIDIHQY